MLSDLDYSDYLSGASPSLLELAKTLLDQGVWKYTSVFLAQPFDVAKVVLQVQDASIVAGEDEDEEKSRVGSSSVRAPYDVCCSAPRLTTLTWLAFL